MNGDGSRLALPSRRRSQRPSEALLRCCFRLRNRTTTDSMVLGSSKPPLRQALATHRYRSKKTLMIATGDAEAPACRLPAACLPPACRLPAACLPDRQGQAGTGRDPSPYKLQCLVLLASIAFLCGFNFLSALKNEEGNKHYQQGRIGKAKTAYSDALKSDPRSPEIAFNLGNAYYKEESFKDSLGVYKKAAEDPKNPLLQSEAFYNLGNTLYRSQDTAKAAQFYKQALRIDPKDQDAKYNLELLTQKAKQDQKKDQNKQQQKDQKQNQNNQQNQGGGGQGQSSDQNQQKKDEQRGGGGESAGQQKEGQDKEQSQQPNDQENKDQKDQKSQGQNSEQKQDQQKSGQEKEQGQNENQDKQSEGQGTGQQQQDQQPQQKQSQASAGEKEDKEQPKPTEAQLRAEQILDALGNQEQKILKMSSNDQKVRRNQRYVEKDW